MSDDPLEVRTVTLGDKTVRMFFSYTALRIAQKRLGHGVALTSLFDQVKSGSVDFDLIIELAGAAAHVVDRSWSADRITDLLDKHPRSMQGLIVEVTAGLGQAYSRMLTDEQKKTMDDASTKDTSSSTKEASSGPSTNGMGGQTSGT